MNAASWQDFLPLSARLRARLSQDGPRIATWILGVILAIQAALILTNLAGATRMPAAQPAAAAPAAHRSLNVAAIVSSHLFGTAPAAPVDAADAPQTRVALVLTGIIAGKDPSTGFAIVGETANAAKVHAVGDRLPGGVKLHSVESDRVLLERDGALESLMLPRQALAGAPPPQPPAQTLPFVDSADRVRRLIAEEPGALSQVLRPQPVFAQGKQRGYRVYPGPNIQAFTRLGLRPGDLVVAVNGTPLDDPSRGQEIFRTIGSSSEAHVTVMRNGRQQDLTLNMTQIANEADQLGTGTPPPSPDVGRPGASGPESAD